MDHSQRLAEKCCRYQDTFPKTSRPKFNLERAKVLKRELRRRTNKDAIVLRLPLEITALIFKFVQLRDSENFYVQHYEWCWLVVTHVCKLWRETAIGIQDLWSYIDIDRLFGAEQMAVYLARSGTSQLTVHYDNLAMDLPTSLQCLYLSLVHFRRIKELHIWSLPTLEFPNELRIALFDNPAPAMQKFTLYRSMDVLDASTLFQGQAPRLTGLCLCMDSPSWVDAPVMRNLTYLCISTHRSMPLSLQDTFSILSENLNIQKFSISSLKSVAHNVNLPQLPIQLPFLVDFKVTASHDVLCQLLQNIFMPNLRGWSISCSVYPVEFNPSANVRSVVPRTARNIDCWSLRLVISPLYVGIDADRSSSFFGLEGGGDYPRRSLHCSREDPDDENLIHAISIVEEIEHLCGLIEGGFWCSARCLSVELDTFASANRDLLIEENLGHAPWIRLLCMFPALEELTVQRCGSVDTEQETVAKDTHHGLLEALMGMYVEEDHGTCLIVQDLAVLCLYGMDLECGLLHLEEVLGFRAAYGKRLRKLSLCQPFGVTDVVLNKLEGFVAAERILIDGKPVDALSDVEEGLWKLEDEIEFLNRSARDLNR